MFGFIFQRLNNRKFSIVIWSVWWLLLGFVFSSLFSTLAQEAAEYDKIIGTLPPALLSSFNIAAGYLSRVETFLSGQFLTTFGLIGSVFALFIGVGELRGKLEDGSVYNWLTKSLSRTSIFTGQWLVNIIFLSLGNLIIWSLLYFQFYFLSDQKDISVDYFVNAGLGTFLVFLVWTSFGALIGTIFTKSRSQSLGVGLIVLSWFLNNLASLSGFPAWLEKLSVFSYFDTGKLRQDYVLDWSRIWVLPVLSVIFVLIGLSVFRQKDL